MMHKLAPALASVALALTFLVGCDRTSRPPNAPDGSERPLVIDAPDTDVEPDDPPIAAADDELATRQRALRVFASEQRTVLARLEGQARFVQARFDRRRVFDAVSRCASELARIEGDISTLERAHGMSADARDARISEVKGDLRRLAVRMSNMEAALGQR